MTLTISKALVRNRWAYFSFLSILALFFLISIGEQQALLAAEEGESVADEHIIIFMAKSAGIVFGPLLFFVSLALTALIVLLMLDLRLEKSIPPAFVEEFTATVNARKFREAFELARNNDSAVGRVLTAGMSRLQYGIDDAREASMNMLESIRSSKEQLNNYTAVIGTLGPMLGLVGTVYGMIESFKVLGAGGSPKPAELAKGISHALVVTLLGIALSVPAIFFNAFFRNRITSIATDTGNIADDLLTQMYHNSKKAAPAGPTPGAPGAPGSTVVPPQPGR